MLVSGLRGQVHSTHVTPGPHIVWPYVKALEWCERSASPAGQCDDNGLTFLACLLWVHGEGQLRFSVPLLFPLYPSSNRALALGRPLELVAAMPKTWLAAPAWVHV